MNELPVNIIIMKIIILNEIHVPMRNKGEPST